MSHHNTFLFLGGFGLNPTFSDQITLHTNKDGKDMIPHSDMWTLKFLKLKAIVHIFLKISYYTIFALFKISLRENSTEKAFENQ